MAFEALEWSGLLISDDANDKSAWSDFCRSKNATSKAIPKVSGTRDEFAFLVKSYRGS